MAGIWCCRECKERQMGCHSTCEKYLKQREEWEQVKDKIKTDNASVRASRIAKVRSHVSSAIRNKSHKR